MRKSQRTYTVLAALLIILALLLPIIGTALTAQTFRPDDAGYVAAEEDNWAAFFTAVAYAVILLVVLGTTSLLACILSGTAIGCASRAVAAAREEACSVILPRILQIIAIIETVVAALVALAPLVLRLAMLTM